MTTKTIPPACEDKRAGSFWTGAFTVALISAIIVINTCFYRASAEGMAEHEARTRATLEDHEVRLRTSEQNAAATVVELRTIREQLSRIESQVGASACAHPNEESGI